LQPTGARDLSGPWFALGVAGVALAVAGYYALAFGSLAGFVEEIDHCERIFCDFELHFYPVGKGIFAEHRPVTYFVYPPFAAFLFGAFGIFEYPTARALWGAVQAVLALALFLLARPDPRRDRAWLWLGYALVFLTSVPLLHNTKWGQVSVAITAAVLGCFELDRRGHRVAAALLLAAATAVKIYPALFAVHFALRRDWRFLGVFAAGAVAFLVALPLAVLGVEGTLAFHRQTNEWIAQLTPEFLSRWNTQYAAAALSRVLWRRFDPGSPAGIAFAALGYALAAANLAGLWQMHRRGVAPLDVRSAALLFLALPLLMPITWPHYLVYLPWCQLVLARLALRRAGTARAVALAAVAVSVALASVFALRASGHWILYARRGWLAWADLVLLAGFWAEAAPALLRRRTPAPEPVA
jgi:alpha-1,2-mannosyltransferase